MEKLSSQTPSPVARVRFADIPTVEMANESFFKIRGALKVRTSPPALGDESFSYYEVGPFLLERTISFLGSRMYMQHWSRLVRE